MVTCSIFFKYFFVLSLFPHSSHAFDLQLPLKSISISLNSFMTSGLKGPNWHCIPSSQASTSLLSSFHGTGLSLGNGPKGLLCPVLPVTAGTQQLYPKETQPPRRPCAYKSSWLAEGAIKPKLQQPCHLPFKRSKKIKLP